MHYHLLHQTHDVRYRHIFMAAANNLLDYRRKSDLSEEVSDVELALHALYGNLLLKLQKKEIHAQTTAAMESFSRMLAYLSAVYKRMEEENE